MNTRRTIERLGAVLTADSYALVKDSGDGSQIWHWVNDSGESVASILISQASIVDEDNPYEPHPEGDF